MITKVVIRNYKTFASLELELNDGLNILVGDNEAGKSTILEAINLAVTKRLNGRGLEQELTPYLFNQEVISSYVASLATAAPQAPPAIEIDVHLRPDPDLASLRGSMNAKREDAVGIHLEVALDEEYAAEYATLLKEHRTEIATVPVEYYKVHWRSFAGAPLTTRSLPASVSHIDATVIRLQSGADQYVQELIRSDLDPRERVGLSLAYRRLKEIFASQDAIKGINDGLTSKKGAITQKRLAISIDVSQRTNWETSLIPHLDDLPFQLIGKGEQSALKIMLALDRKAGSAETILIEEPENHLSFASMNILLKMVQEKCEGKQILVTTHSAYVLNKLGLGRLILLGRGGKISTLAGLSADTQEYFEVLPGYDTLRLVLARRAILVEGPSDELVIQRAYRDVHGKLPIEDGIDVISVRGLSFARFLEVAEGLHIRVEVVTDNDGDPAKVDKKYAGFTSKPGIKLHRSGDARIRTLEPALLAANDLARLNTILGRAYRTEAELLRFMTENKTEVALRVFKAERISFPQYILDAVA